MKRKVLSVFLCFVMILTAVPMAAFAQEEIIPYCEIKLKEGYSAEILPGESTHIIFDYELGKYEYNCDFDYYVIGGTYEWAEPNSIAAGMIITSKTHGTIKVRMIIKSCLPEDWDEVIAEDEFEITVVDTRTEKEKFKEKFDLFVAEMQLLGLFAFLYGVIAPIATVVFSPYYAYLTISEIINWIADEVF